MYIFKHIIHQFLPKQKIPHIFLGIKSFTKWYVLVQLHKSFISPLSPAIMMVIIGLKKI